MLLIGEAIYMSGQGVYWISLDHPVSFDINLKLKKSLKKNKAQFGISQ